MYQFQSINVTASRDIGGDSGSSLTKKDQNQMFSKITPKGYMQRSNRVDGFIDLYGKNILQNDLILREDEFLGLLDKKYDTTMHKCKVYHNPFNVSKPTTFFTPCI